MSYALALTPEAYSGLQKLASDLQEDLLDELDRFASDPVLLPPRRTNNVIYVEIVKERQGTRHIIFNVIRISHARKSIEVVRIGHVEQTMS